MKSGFPTRPAGRSIRAGGAWEGVNVAKIESTADLPEWFDLDKYKGCEDFGAIEWLDQLCRRARLFESNSAWVVNQPLSPSKANIAAMRALWLDIVADELTSLQREPLKQRNNEHLSQKEFQPIGMVSAIDLNQQRYRDEMGFHDGLCPEEKYLRWGAWDLNQEGKGAGIAGIRAARQHPIFLEGYPPARAPQAVVRVDLGATDAALKKAFEAWLVQARADLPRPTNPIYSKWARYGLLPYLDLKIWEEGTGNNIPDRVMSSALSRNGFDAGESNIRKTLAPLADGLMQDLSALQALAAIEAATRSPINPETFEH